MVVRSAGARNQRQFSTRAQKRPITACGFRLDSTLRARLKGARAGSTEALDLTGRLVHHFDFDERDQRNLEAISKLWTRFGGDRFAHYVRGEFDADIGHGAPPSFHLVAEGRSVAYRYRGEATPVDLRNDFLIVGWIRGDGLANARAALSAY